MPGLRYVNCRWREWRDGHIEVCHNDHAREGPWCLLHQAQGRRAMKKTKHVFRYIESA